MKKIILLFLLCSVTIAGPIQMPKNLDRYVGQVMQTFKVPGLSLAIVKDGRVVLSKGYGIKSTAAPEPVNGQTLFGIASNTKAFTATALAILVEQGAVQWDAAVIDYLPSFRMYDPYVTRELTVRDLLVHRSGLGLGAGDLMWWPASSYSRKEIVERIKYLKPVTSFRTAYAYDNVLYSVAGEVVESVSGLAWEDFVQQRILQPVGMTHSLSRISRITEAANVAVPHAEINGSVRPVRAFTKDNVNPAGGICSCSDDMAKWMIVQLDSGRLANGTRLFSPASNRQLWSLVTPIPISDPPSYLSPIKTDFRGYGLGFSQAEYRGHKVVQHTGGLPGYVSKVTMIPEIDLGVTVLTNQESDYAFAAITNYIMDYYLAAQWNWLASYVRFKAHNDSMLVREQKEQNAERIASSRPSLALSSYAGIYTDVWYGDMTMTLENEKLVLKMSHTPGLVGDLEHWHYDTFVCRWRDAEMRADAFVTFYINAEGNIGEVKMKAVSSATDFSFDFQDLLFRPKAVNMFSH
jgi:CubicO group peptidase (beta-lactamase class C family)